MIRVIFRWQSLLYLLLPYSIIMAYYWMHQSTIQGVLVLGYGANALISLLACLAIYLALPRFRLAEERRPWQQFCLALLASLVYQIYALVSIPFLHSSPLPWVGAVDFLLVEGLICAGLMSRAGQYPRSVYGKLAVLGDIVLMVLGMVLIADQLPIRDILFNSHCLPLDRVQHLGYIIALLAMTVTLQLSSSMAVPRFQRTSRLLVLTAVTLWLASIGTVTVLTLLNTTPCLLTPVMLWGMGCLVLVTAICCEVASRPKEANDARIVEDAIPVLGLFVPAVIIIGAAVFTVYNIGHRSFTAQQAMDLVEILVIILALAIARMLVMLLWNRQTFAELQAELKESERLGMTDALTGVPNKRACMQRLEGEVARSMRYKRPLSLVFSDIDFFKLINDVHGHHVGDLALCAVANLLQEKVRTTDMVARLGGEEFVLVLPETTLAQATLLAGRLREAVEEYRMPLPTGGTLQMTISLGVSACPETSTTVESLLDDADQAMNHAKDTGRNRVVPAQASQRLFVVDQA